MYCTQAKSVSVCGIDGMASAGMWVDFGLTSLSVGLLIPEADSEGGEGEEGGGGGAGGAGSQLELDVVQFPYSESQAPVWACVGRCESGWMG